MAMATALVALLSLAFLRPKSSAPDLSLNPGTIPSLSHNRYAEEPASRKPSQTNGLTPILGQFQTASNAANTEAPEARHKAYVASRLTEMQGLSMREDAGSLDTILSELCNRDPEIRAGALEAAIQFGSRDAIPKLIDAASQTDDPKEKAALDEAVEFLKLPSLREVLAENRK